MLEMLVSVHFNLNLYDTQIEPQIICLKQHQQLAHDTCTVGSVQNISAIKNGEFLDQPKDWILKNSLPQGTVT
jgi:hypothetical protein